MSLSRSVSPARSHGSYVANPYEEERSGYFSVVDSSAPRIPSAERFQDNHFGPYSSTPGPGYYDPLASSGSFYKKSGPATIPKAERFGKEALAGKGEFLARSGRDLGGSPGPAAYNVNLAATSPKGSFGKAVRGDGYLRRSAATGAHVGPGSYTPDISVRKISGFKGSFTRARRTTGRNSDPIPGPGCYETSSCFSRVKGGSFSRTPRSSPINPHTTSPGIGAYTIDSSLSRKGTPFTKALRTQSHLDTTPGPGAYSPLFAARSR